MSRQLDVTTVVQMSRRLIPLLAHWLWGPLLGLLLVALVSPIFAVLWLIVLSVTRR